MNPRRNRSGLLPTHPASRGSARVPPSRPGTTAWSGTRATTPTLTLTLRRPSDAQTPRPRPAALPPSGPDRRSPGGVPPTPDDATCEHCAELAARCAAADAAARHLSATLNRLRSTLDAVESLAERQAAHEQGSERHLNALESKLDSYRDALRRFTSVSPGDSLEHSPSRAEHERGSVPDRGRGRGGLRRERSTDALGVHKVHGGKRYEAYLPGKLTEIVPGDVSGA